MAVPSVILPGFNATMYAQPTSTPTALTTATGIGTYATVNALCITANQLNIEAIPAFGMDDAVASFSVAGQRVGDKIPVQAAPTSMTITAPWNPSDAMLLILRGDAYDGKIDRTFFIKVTNGSTDALIYAFNARVGSFQIDASPGAEAKAIFTIHPRGGSTVSGAANAQFAWSNS